MNFNEIYIITIEPNQQLIPYEANISRHNQFISITNDTNYNNGQINNSNQRHWRRKMVHSVVFNSRCTTISLGKLAFHSLYNLQHIVLPTKLQIISDRAFEFCTSLVDILIPSSVTEICYHAFSGCSSLIRIVIPHGVKIIGHGAFIECQKMISVQIPSTIIKIHRSAFMSCCSLINIDIPIGISLDLDIFEDCSFLNHSIRIDHEEVGKGVSPSELITKYTVGRFEGLPLHSACYDPNITTGTILHVIRNNPKEILTCCDAFGMNALHILACNAMGKKEIIAILSELSADMNYCQLRDSDELLALASPVQIFLTAEGFLNTHNYGILSIDDLINKCCKWKGIKLALDYFNHFKKDDNVYPFITAACSSDNLEILYNLTMLDIDRIIALR